MLAHSGGRRTDLPTYNFQPESYWMRSARRQPQLSPTDFGLTPTGHPILTTEVPLPETGAHLYTGQLCLTTHPWLADHLVLGSVLLPGTAMTELVLGVCRPLGLPVIEELTLSAPMVLPNHGALQVQLVLDAPDEHARRRIRVRSRLADALPGEPWTEHARGEAGPAEPHDDAGVLSDWPPSGAQEIDVEEMYQAYRESGCTYGPAFRGLTGAWQLGDEIYTEARLPAALSGPDTYVLHPALFDSALQGALQLGAGGLRLPFSFSRVHRRAEAGTILRTRMTPLGPDTAAVLITDDAGRPVLTIDSLALRAVSREEAVALRGRPPLLTLAWPVAAPAADPPPPSWTILGDDPSLPADDTRGIVRYPELTDLVQALDRGMPVPGAVVCPVPAGGDGPEYAHTAVMRTANLLRQWLNDERLTTTRLLLLTRHAVAVTPDEEIRDLANASLWGLLASAQREHPGRFVLADLDDSADLGAALPAILAGDDSRVAVRGSRIHVPRLRRAAAATTTAGLRPGGTVLITGGTGTLGAAVARHLAGTYGVRHLLLASRSGEQAAGAAQLAADLVGLGVTTRIVACDVADRQAVADLLASIPAEYPLTAVVHTAGSVADAVLETLTAEQVAAVLRPKVTAALILDELTRDADLDEFVLFSGAAGALGTAGQAHYAAANVFLEALARRRRQDGRPARALAWGLWAERSGITGDLDEVALRRLARLGVRPLPTDEALALLDEALGAGDPIVYPLGLDPAVLRSQAETGELAPILRELAPTPVRPAADVAPARPAEPSATLLDRLLGASPEDQDTMLVELVREQVADVLGHTSTRQIGADEAFRDLGIDSLSAVELRNRLGGLTDLRLPPTIVFDHPTPAGIAAHLRDELMRDHQPSSDDLLYALGQLDELLSASETTDVERARIVARLGDLAAKFGGARTSHQHPATVKRLDQVSDDELFAYIDNEL
ncbi:SDR family NAD(P)-dependent oxidoreductase [Micromonospora parva]|uniref:SDR family NAD(P)-dependent oxidoreductase n=1 Tax=Micromonospora parva TaxID=1464048 RepID=UPI0033F8C9E6